MRTVSGIPEGGCHIDDIKRFRVVDKPHDEVFGEGVIGEWVITYIEYEGSNRTAIFIVHAKTKEDAFNHFISIYPEMIVKALEYYGPYW